MQEGYIKLHRCILDSSWSRHSDFVAVWVYCLLRANYLAGDVVTKGGAIVHLEPGQFMTSREQISVGTGVQESKVERILKVFKSEQQIEQQNCGKFRVISIVNWQKYQSSEQQNEQQMNNKRTANEHKQEGKEGKEKTLSEFEQERLRFFDLLWRAYPKDGRMKKKEALRHYLTSVKTDADLDRINLSLGCYIDHLKANEWKRPQNASTWFNNWQDWEPTDAD